MKNFLLVVLYGRFRELLIKCVSVKGTFAVFMSVVYLKSPTNPTLIGVVAAWGLFIGAREFEKLKGILPKWGS